MPIPAKANKPDLIQKIMDNPAALSVFEESHGSGAKPSGASTPRPATVASIPIEKGATENDVGVTEAEKGSDIVRCYCISEVSSILANENDSLHLQKSPYNMCYEFRRY